jgi:glutathione S-transferase
MGSTSKTVPILYTFSGSGNSYKIRLLQALLGIDIKHEELDFLVGQI